MFKKYSSLAYVTPRVLMASLTFFSLFGPSNWSHQLTSKTILGKELYYKYNFILFPVNASITIYGSYNFFNIYYHLQIGCLSDSLL